MDLATGFEEPLIATGPTSSGEDEALARAVSSYRGQAAQGDFQALEGFLADHPGSSWRVSILTNLGLSYYHSGYFSKTIDALETAWREGRSVKEPRAKALVDRAVGELLRMHARLGHSERLAALFEDIGERALTGPATELRAGAKEGLWAMFNDPGVAFLCGPMALKNALLAKGVPAERLAYLDEYRSSPQGVTLAEVAGLADQAQLPYRLMRREVGASIPVPSVVHWKVSHFAAIVEESEGRYRIEDPTFGQDLWVTRDAIDTEGSGYFLALRDQDSAGWRDVGADEASQIRGMGYTTSNKPSATTPQDDKTKGCSGSGGMCGYDFTEMVVSLNLNDRPVGYAPPKGPPVYVTLTYNQREASQPANFSFFNVGPKWTLNWLSYIQDRPANPHDVTRYVAGGGSVSYKGYNATTNAYKAEARDAAHLVRTSAAPIKYERRLSDGSKEVYAKWDGATVSPRRIFLTQIIDPAGNAVTLNYDNRLRLTSLTDATGRSTTFDYGLSAQPLLVTQITDPFGRSATLTYDSMGRLESITDVLGLTSSFSYDASSLVDAMTTPYGTTNFAYGETAGSLPNLSRFVQATDPLKHTERLEFRHQAPGISFSDPAGTVPQGITTPNSLLWYRNTFYWDKHAYHVAAGDYTKARNKHWVHNFGPVTGDTVETLNNPLESRVWYNYPGQVGSNIQPGSYDLPSRIGRVLDDGTTQLRKFDYNAFGKIKEAVDPVGRTTQFAYAANQIDLTAVTQITASGPTTIARFGYNNQHRPMRYEDAAGQSTSYEYNSAGQLTKITDPLGNITTYKYDGTGYLLAIINANGLTQASFTYDNFGRVATRTDSERHTVSYTYDAMDRITKETYPDGTSRIYVWDKLDLVTVKDRQGRRTEYTYDAVRNLTSITDPLGNTTKFDYYENQKLRSLTDAKGNTTSWDIDIQGRVIAKRYPDSTVVALIYEPATSRLRFIDDAMGQRKQYTYARDDQITNIDYQNTVNPTPNVQFAYDLYFPLIKSMTDGTGTTSYQHHPVGSLGALQVAQEDGPFANDVIGYQYDELGRIVRREVSGSIETFAYDALGRPISDTNALGSFSMHYLGQTAQITALYNGTGTVGSNWSYETNLKDRRLHSITHNGAARGYQYITTPENVITTITESGGNAAGPVNWAYGYDAADRLLTAQSSATTTQYAYAYDPTDNLTTIQKSGSTNTVIPNGVNQIGTFNGTAFSYDANGNLAHDNQRTYQWDAENRLVGIGYDVEPTKQTTFRYDGLGRRIAITTTNGGAVNETRHLWCGETLCQARDASDVVTRWYFSEGEEIPSAGELLYYSRDHLGSVRNLSDAQTGTGVASYDYDPYGDAIQTGGQVSADLRYAGMFYEPDSGLYLTHYRAYDPRTGRWLSRDPLGEGFARNLYEYVDGNPLSYTDPNGLARFPGGLKGQDAFCAKLLKTIRNHEHSINRRIHDLNTDPSGGKMKETCPGDLLNPGLSLGGHRIMIYGDMALANFKRILYAAYCKGPQPPPIPRLVLEPIPQPASPETLFDLEYVPVDYGYAAPNLAPTAVGVTAMLVIMIMLSPIGI